MTSKAGCGGVYHVVIGISDFDPTQRVFIRGGVLGFDRDGTEKWTFGKRLRPSKENPKI